VAVPKVVFTLIEAMLGRLVLLFRSADDKDAEILALGHQLGVLQRQVPRRGSRQPIARSSRCSAARSDVTVSARSC
jgi:hypothetical protein